MVQMEPVQGHDVDPLRGLIQVLVLVLVNIFVLVPQGPAGAAGGHLPAAGTEPGRCRTSGFCGGLKRYRGNRMWTEAGTADSACFQPISIK